MLVAVNPFSKTHGAPEDEERHVGDLGNIKTDGQGNSKASTTDKHIKLIGEQSVLGVSFTPLRPFSPGRTGVRLWRNTWDAVMHCFGLCDDNADLYSVPLSYTPVPTTLAREDSRRARRQATRVPVLHVVLLALLLKARSEEIV